MESNIFRQREIVESNIGKTFGITFDARRGDLDGDSVAFAIIKTIDPNNNSATTNFIRLNLTTIPETWGTYTVSFEMNDPVLVGQRLQYGFASRARRYEPAGMYYDNVKFCCPPFGTMPEETPKPKKDLKYWDLVLKGLC